MKNISISNSYLEQSRCNLRKSYSQKLSLLNTLKIKYRSIYSTRYKSESINAIKKLGTDKKENLEKVILFAINVKRNLQSLLDSNDAELIKLILKYFNIIERETILNKERINLDNVKYYVDLQKLTLKRNIKLFSNHIFQETKGMVDLVYLEKESAAFKRCEKAFYDNLEKTVSENFKVSNVLKLENTLLSENFQANILLPFKIFFLPLLFFIKLGLCPRRQR